MPIATEEDVSYADMQKIVDGGHKCSCGGRVSIAWGGSHGIDSYILRCAKDIEHRTINRHDKVFEKNLKIVREVRHMDTTALQTMTEAQMTARVEKARFPKELNPKEKSLLATACITYGFDPIMGELTIYQGSPFVSVDGRYRKAQETGELAGVESRPANKQERLDWEIPDGDYFFRAEVYRSNSQRPFVGWGRVRKVEIDKANEYTPVSNNPQRMAEKRAEVQALRKAFHIPLPSMELIGSQDDEDIRVVNTTTGEIIEGEANEIVEAPSEPRLEDEEPKASPVQLKKIYATYKAMGYTDELAMSIMLRKFNKGHSKELTKHEASELIELFTQGYGLEPKPEETEPTEGQPF